MNPEFAAWLNGVLEWLGNALCISLGVGVILGTILIIYLAIDMQKEANKKSKNPTCFGKPITPNGRAENGCEDCPLEAKCK